MPGKEGGKLRRAVGRGEWLNLMHERLLGIYMRVAAFETPK